MLRSREFWKDFGVSSALMLAPILVGSIFLALSVDLGPALLVVGSEAIFILGISFWSVRCSWKWYESHSSENLFDIRKRIREITGPRLDESNTI